MADPTFGWDVCKMKGCMAMLAPRAGVVTFAPNHTLILCTTQHFSPEAKYEILRILQTMKMSCWSGSNTLILTTGRQMVPRSFLWDSLQSWSECFLWSRVQGVECATFWDELSRLLICQNDLRFLGGKMRRSQRSLLRLGALAHICGRQGQRQGQGQVGQGCPSPPLPLRIV